MIKLKSESTENTKKQTTIRAEEETDFIYTFSTIWRKSFQFILSIMIIVVMLYAMTQYDTMTLNEKLMMIILMLSIANIELSEMIIDEVQKKK